MKTISTEQAAKMIRGSNGKIFSATVIKRTTGSLRRMTGRLAVTPKAPSETGASYNAKDHDLIRVSEFVRAEHTERNAKGQFSGNGNMKVQYRAIAIEGLRSLKIGGESFAVKQ